MSQAAAPGTSVLVVDDTVENLRLLSALLGEHGYDVRAVTSGRQALQAVEHDPPDVILLDITMPEMDGFEVCRRLKATERATHIPVIFLTALTDAAAKVRAFDFGGVDYVTKPFQFEEVLARVRTHVALTRAQKALADSYTRLRALEQLRDDLVHMIVHDLRSPLTALHINLNLLKGPVASLGEDSRRDLDASVELVQVLTRMANELLDVSRLEEGRMPIERAACDLTQIAHEVRSALRPIDVDRPIEIESAGSVCVQCDRTLVRRVLENLVSNGITHTPAGSRMRISISRRDGRVRVAVHDQGRGVPLEARARIFEKFGTLENRHERSYQSVGLGLAFCKLAIEAQSGTIGVDAGVPVGSTFWFELPSDEGR
ncbi:MAG TPA: response regulator [Vicinamibacterales bacterium]|jgi:signal transduction histidine kinase